MAEDCVVLLPLCDGMRLLLRGQAHGKKGGGIDGQDGCRSPIGGSCRGRKISWHQALAMMMERNIDLKKSEQSLKTTKRSVINVFTQIIPGVNLDWMLTKELSDLAKVTASDVEYNTNILFNMPSLTQIPFDYYSAKAAVYTAEKDAGDEKKGAGAQIVPAGAFLPECADQLQ